jgi:hypothetical protein
MRMNEKMQVFVCQGGRATSKAEKGVKCVRFVLQLSVDLPSTQILAAFLVRYPETENNSVGHFSPSSSFVTKAIV